MIIWQLMIDNRNSIRQKHDDEARHSMSGNSNDKGMRVRIIYLISLPAFLNLGALPSQLIGMSSFSFQFIYLFYLIYDSASFNFTVSQMFQTGVLPWMISHVEILILLPRLREKLLSCYIMFLQLSTWFHTSIAWSISLDICQKLRLLLNQYAFFVYIIRIWYCY